MARNIVPINNQHHAHLKIKPGISLDHVKDEHVIPVTVHEFVHLSADFPVAFAKNPETGQFHAVGMMGFKAGENYQVQNGEWAGQLPPGIVSTYPFSLVPNPHDENQMYVTGDMDSDLFDVDEGEALFNEDGTETEAFVTRKNNVTNYYEHSQMTHIFCAMIASMDLFESRNLSIDLNGEKAGIEGIYMISEEKLNALPDEKFLDLKQRGFLPAIFAHIASINQVRRLAKLRMQKLAAEG